MTENGYIVITIIAMIGGIAFMCALAFGFDKRNPLPDPLMSQCLDDRWVVVVKRTGKYTGVLTVEDQTQKFEPLTKHVTFSPDDLYNDWEGPGLEGMTFIWRQTAKEMIALRYEDMRWKSVA